MNEIEKLKPTCIWRNFYALTQIPRPSGHVEIIFENMVLQILVQKLDWGVHRRRVDQERAIPSEKSEKSVVFQECGCQISSIRLIRGQLRVCGCLQTLCVFAPLRGARKRMPL